VTRFALVEGCNWDRSLGNVFHTLFGHPPYSAIQSPPILGANWIITTIGHLQGTGHRTITMQMTVKIEAIRKSTTVLEPPLIVVFRRNSYIRLASPSKLSS
jgi:hypothetical protein